LTNIKSLIYIVQSLTEKAPGISTVPSLNVHLSILNTTGSLQCFKSTDHVNITAKSASVELGFNTFGLLKNLLSIDITIPTFEVLKCSNDHSSVKLFNHTINSSHDPMAKIYISQVDDIDSLTRYIKIAVLVENGTVHLPFSDSFLFNEEEPIQSYTSEFNVFQQVIDVDFIFTQICMTHQHPEGQEVVLVTINNLHGSMNLIKDSPTFSLDTNISTCNVYIASKPCILKSGKFYDPISSGTSFKGYITEHGFANFAFLDTLKVLLNNFRSILGKLEHQKYLLNLMLRFGMTN
jgi:hypothetical protein